MNRKGNGTPLQYSCLENPMDGGAWRAAIYGVAQSRTRLKRLSSSSSSSMKKSVMTRSRFCFQTKVVRLRNWWRGPGRAGTLCLASSSRRLGLQLGNQSRSVHSIVRERWGLESKHCTAKLLQWHQLLWVTDIYACLQKNSVFLQRGFWRAGRLGRRLRVHGSSHGGERF